MNINYDISDEKALIILEQKCAYQGIQAIPATTQERKDLLTKLLQVENMQLYAAIMKEKAVIPVNEALKVDTEIIALGEALEVELKKSRPQGLEAVEVPADTPVEK
jgi:hypothetical protein